MPWSSNLIFPKVFVINLRIVSEGVSITKHHSVEVTLDIYILPLVEGFRFGSPKASHLSSFPNFIL